MNKTYSELNRIWNAYISQEKKDFSDDVHNILTLQGIGLREDGSILKQITISTPTKETDSYVVGLRYLKKDNTYTEDQYFCPKNKPARYLDKEIKLYPKNKLEILLAEYKGTHKQQVNFENDKIVTNNESEPITQVNTISNYFDKK